MATPSFLLFFNLINTPNTTIQAKISSANLNANFTLNNATDPGGRATGIRGAALDGYTFGYKGSSNETISINIIQGIADKMYNALYSLISPVFNYAHSITDCEVIALRTENTDNQDKISSLDEKVKAEIDTFKKI